MRHDRHPEDPARGSSQDAEAAHLPAGIREARPPMRRRRAGSCPVPGTSGRAGIDRPRAADDRAAYQGSEVPGDQESGQLRLQSDPKAQQDAGAGTRAMQLDRATRECHRLGAQWNRQDPCCPRAGAGGLPEGPLGQLHHRRRAGQRTDGGPRRASSAKAAKAVGRRQIADLDELGFVPLSKTGAELLFELISQRYERGSTLITSNFPFEEWTETFGTERLTGALLDRLTHHVNILEMNGESYRLNQSRARLAAANK